MQPSFSIKNKTLSPPLFLAPMAGLTHSALRRLISDFGGYGALFTEMLSGKALPAEHIHTSPYTKKRACEGNVIYQLLLCGDENIERIIEKVQPCEPWGIDLNAACPAPEIAHQHAGFALFKDFSRLTKVCEGLRKNWCGPLSVKVRLGMTGENWEPYFYTVLRMFYDTGIDFITIHPRFASEKLKRPAKFDALTQIINQTNIPIILNGDILEPSFIQEHSALVDKVAGLMIGRMAIIKPWIFSEFQGENPAIDYCEVWTRFYKYVNEDFPPEKAIGRIKEFSAWYSRNFFFGHQFYKQVQSALTLDALFERAVTFLEGNPTLSANPSAIQI